MYLAFVHICAHKFRDPEVTGDYMLSAMEAENQNLFLTKAVCSLISSVVLSTLAFVKFFISDSFITNFKRYRISNEVLPSVPSFLTFFFFSFLLSTPLSTSSSQMFNYSSTVHINTILLQMCCYCSFVGVLLSWFYFWYLNCIPQIYLYL